MDDVRVEVREQPPDPGDSARGHADLAVLRHREAGDSEDSGTCDLARTIAATAGCDDDGFVSALGQMVEHAEQAVADPVHLREERFCDHCDSHMVHLT